VQRSLSRFEVALSLTEAAPLKVDFTSVAGDGEMEARGLSSIDESSGSVDRSSSLVEISSVQVEHSLIAREIEAQLQISVRLRDVLRSLQDH